MTTATDPAPALYGRATESMQTVPEARRRSGGAGSADFPALARCAAYFPADMEWVPDTERRVVPAEMAALCTGCPVRAQCLRWALSHEERGYWAGTTSSDRAQLRRDGRDDVAAADALREAALRDLAQRRDADARGALHAPGEGGRWWYRGRGCRCEECRRSHADARSAERAAARARRTAAGRAA